MKCPGLHVEVTSQIYLNMTANSEFPDYYKLLDVPKTASQDEIRQAYKRESLKYVNSTLRLGLITHCSLLVELILIDWPRRQQRKRGSQRKDSR